MQGYTDIRIFLYIYIYFFLLFLEPLIFQEYAGLYRDTEVRVFILRIPNLSGICRIIHYYLYIVHSDFSYEQENA